MWVVRGSAGHEEEIHEYDNPDCCFHPIEMEKMKKTKIVTVRIKKLSKSMFYTTSSQQAFWLEEDRGFRGGLIQYSLLDV